MPAHQFPTSTPIRPRLPHHAEQYTEVRSQASQRFPVRPVGSLRHVPKSSQSPENHTDPPPAYSEPHLEPRGGAHSIPQWGTSVRDKAAREKRKPSWNLVGRVEDKYWQLTTADNVLLRWSLEIFSWTVSAVCMAVIVLLLLLVGGRKAPSWPISSYISVISRLATSALLLPTTEALGQLKWHWFQSGDAAEKRKMWDFELIDSASRGPVGSFMLLLRMKGGTLAAFGAAVILLAVGLDPFFQQVIDLPQRLVLHSHNATIPRVKTWQSDRPADIRNGTRIWVTDQDLGKTFERFAFAAPSVQTVLDNGATSADVPLTCPTSNCTWPQYETLAVCSECREVYDLVTFDCLDAPLDWVSSIRVPQVVGVNESFPRSRACGYYINATSDAPMLMSGHSVDPTGASGEALLMRLISLNNYLKPFSYYAGSIHFQGRSDLLADFVVVGIDGPPASVYSDNFEVTAHECALNWCVKSMVSEYHEGRYTETTTRSFENTTSGLGMVPFQYKMFNIPNGIPYRSQYDHNVTISPPYLEPNETFGLSNITAMEALMIFQEVLPSYWTINGSSAEPRFRSGNILQTLTSIRPINNNPWLAPYNISAQMERLCITLTNAIRSTGSIETVFGDAFDSETYVKVSWAWMTLPLTVLLASLIFLVITVRSSSKCSQVWKNSAVATLMHALPEEVKQKLQNSRGNPHMLANQLNIKLTPDSTGWRMSVAMEEGSSISRSC